MNTYTYGDMLENESVEMAEGGAHLAESELLAEHEVMLLHLPWWLGASWCVRVRRRKPQNRLERLLGRAPALGEVVWYEDGFPTHEAGYERYAHVCRHLDELLMEAAL